MPSVAPISDSAVQDGEKDRGASTERGLPAEVERWVEEVAGPITALSRHPARREAWLVETAPASGPSRRGFLRLDRPGVTPSVNVEAEVVGALGRVGIPVPGLYGWNRALSCALYERVDGEDSVASLPVDEAQGVMEHFVDLVGAWHRLDARSLGLGLPWPATPEECALNRPNSLSALTGDPGVEPLRRFGQWWIRRHVPRPLPHLVLLQGDTGPGNFIFGAGQVRAVTDWEWARFGDPMEDLGTICCRSLFFGPQVRLAPLFRRYQEASGIGLDWERIRFYRAQQMVQSVIALTALTEHLDPSGPAALNVAYRVRGDFVCCDAIALAMGIGLVEPELPQPDGPDVSPSFDLVNAALQIVEGELGPELEDPYLRERAHWSGRLVETLERRTRLLPALVEIELDDLSGLLGRRPASVADGIVELDRRVAGWGDGSPGRAGEEEVLGYLWRRACRNEHLYEPLLRFLPARRFSPIEER
jgi:aminoglycoside phosphotransferase (APT) family kinase protein